MAKDRRSAGRIAVALFCGLALFAAPTVAVADDHWGAVPDWLEVCDVDHPAVVQLAADVEYSVTYLYPDMASLLARGYIPYFDLAFFGPVGAMTNGFTHWLHPGYIDNGIMLDPFRPESILADEWGRAMGIMFIADDGLHPGPPLYVDPDTGYECYPPWHTHTDMPARSAWWYYKTVYRGEVDTIPEYTPEMVHIWGVPHPGGFYDHNAPPNSWREGPPPPIGIVPPVSQPPKKGGEDE